MQFDKYSVVIVTPANVATNKLCTVVSRTEPKDFVDLYLLMKEFPETDFESTFGAAKKREALFDDPPTAAYQLEWSLGFVRDHPELMPQLKVPLEPREMFAFFQTLAQKLYQKAAKGR